MSPKTDVDLGSPDLNLLCELQRAKNTLANELVLMLETGTVAHYVRPRFSPPTHSAKPRGLHDSPCGQARVIMTILRAMRRQQTSGQRRKRACCEGRWERLTSRRSERPDRDTHLLISPQRSSRRAPRTLTFKLNICSPLKELKKQS